MKRPAIDTTALIAESDRTDGSWRAIAAKARNYGAKAQKLIEANDEELKRWPTK